MAGSFDNEENTLSDWAKEKVKKKLVQVLTKYGKRKKKVNTVSSEKYSYSLSRQSSETKPRTNLVLVSRKPLLYLEFNKPNKQNVSEINVFKNFNFSQCQNNC